MEKNSDNLNNFSGLYFGPFNDRRVAVFIISRKRRNLFLTITDLTGSVVASLSAKTFASDRKKRFAPHIIELAAKQLITTLKLYRIYAIRLFVKISKSYIAASVSRALKSSNIRFTMGFSMVPIAHNGCRAKKRRRL